MKNSPKIYFLIFIFLIFTTYNTKQNKQSFSLLFPIKEISIQNNLVTDPVELKSDLNFLIKTSLIFLNEEAILSIIDKYEFISKIKIKKKYPNTLKINIIEKIPVATAVI